MTTESKQSRKLNAKTPSVEATRAAALAGDDAEHEALSQRKPLSGRATGAILAGIVAVGVGGGAIAMNAAPERAPTSTSTPDVDPTTQATETGSATPSPDPSSIDVLATQPVVGEKGTAATLEFEAGQEDAALVADFIAGITTWNNSGADTAAELFDSGAGRGKTVDEFAAEVAAGEQSKYIETFFTKSAPNDPDTSLYISRLATADKNTIKYAMVTDPDLGMGNEEHYKRVYELSSPIERVNMTDTTRTLAFTLKGSSNYKKTSFRDKQTDADDIAYNKYVVTFTTAGNVDKIAKLVHTPTK